MSLEKLRSKMRDEELEIARQFGLDPATTVSGSLEFQSGGRLTYTAWDISAPVRGLVAQRVHPPAYPV